jgi:hypothetical protein
MARAFAGLAGYAHNGWTSSEEGGRLARSRTPQGAAAIAAIRAEYPVVII